MRKAPLRLELRIDWSEIDLFGHINNLAIQRYVQAARIQCMEALGLMQSQAETRVGPILASTNCRFRKPLYYPGTVTVHSTIDEIRNTSFKVCYEVHNDSGEIVAEAQDVIVLFDFGKKAKLVIPDALRKMIEKLK